MLPPLIPADARRLAVVLPSWVGDTVMATPVLRALRKLRPEAHLIALLRPGLDELLAGSTWLDEIVVDRHRSNLDIVPAARGLRAARPEAVVILPNSFRSALIARLSGAAVRIGYPRDARRPLLTHALPRARPGIPVAALRAYADLTCVALGEIRIDTRLELFVTAEEDAAADGLLDSVDRPFLLLNPGANDPRKRWPAERFAEVADVLASEHDLAVVVSGAPRESDLAARVASLVHAPAVVDLAGRGVSLGALKAIVRRAALLLTNDTGPRHLAAALDTPVVSLFGPTDHRWTRLDCPHERLVLAAPDLPEELVANDFPERCAIDRIPVDRVLTAVRDLLEDPMRFAPPLR